MTTNNQNGNAWFQKAPYFYQLNGLVFGVVFLFSILGILSLFSEDNLS